MYSIRTGIDIVVALTRVTIFGLCLAMVVGTARARNEPRAVPRGDIGGMARLFRHLRLWQRHQICR